MGIEEDVVLDEASEIASQESEEVIENTNDTGDAEVESEEEKPAEPAFTPDYKFRANQQDMEIPEEFRGLVKDVDSQKKVKDIFEKFHGFETQKTKVSTLEADVNKYRSGYDSLASNIQDIQSGYKHAIESGNLHNLDAVFQKLGLSEDVLMGWAGEKARLQGMEPELQRQIMHANKLEREAYEHARQQNSLAYDNQNKDREIRQMQFDSAMSTPQIQNFASELDSKFGNNGLFAQEVINAGKTAYALEQKVLSVQEAIHQVITKYQLKGQPAQASIPAQGQTPAQSNVSADGKKIVQREQKVIPNVGSAGGASPVGAGKAKNLDDVRKRYRELAGLS